MFDVTHIVQAGGLLLIAAIIFGESGMFIGFFFPGDTLLLTAGVFAGQGKLSLISVIAVVAVAAIIGDNVGYHIGRRYGRKLFRKPNGLVFRQEYVTRAEDFYEKYGSKTMLIAHFIPIVRTFAPAVAGVARMNYKKFVLFDGIGDIAWATSVTLVGYWFGTKIPNIDHYILLVVAGAMIFTLGPTFYHLIKAVIEKHRNQVN
ncbi:MAG TPA: DedA family protein [Candidatus Saccharimonadales bacterium]|nr:DedA family protein [Candidatus Saccharimonadales bacterium]